MYGFVSGFLTNVPRADDRAAIAYLRRQQISRLFGGKTIWK
jgi:hypothetical protein